MALKQYYPQGVKMLYHNGVGERGFDYNGKYIGVVEEVEDWGLHYRAYPTKGIATIKDTLLDAVNYLIDCHKGKT